MNKLTGLVFACALAAFALPANAQLLKNVQTYGELDVTGVMAQNVRAMLNGTSDSYRNTLSRLSFGLSFDLLPDVHSNIMFVNGGYDHGEEVSRNGAGFQANNFINYYGDTGTNGAALSDYENMITVEQANVTIDNLFGLTSAKIGRQFYGEEGGLTPYFGLRHGDEGLYEYSVDGIRLDYNAGKNAAMKILLTAFVLTTIPATTLPIYSGRSSTAITLPPALMRISLC